MEVQRKLVSIRKIAALDPIPGADAIEVATVDGWKLVVKKGEFKTGDRCIYFEIDSFLPESDSRYAFLMTRGVKEFEGIRGHKLRTIKLRGQISQGLALPVNAFPELFHPDAVLTDYYLNACANSDTDFAALLGIKKYEAPIPAALVGQVKGLFPSFIKKTDQERCQNLKGAIFDYSGSIEEIDPTTVTEAIEAGRLKLIDGKVFNVRSAKADPNARYEVTLKLDGTSVTFFHRDGEVGVCSRNLQLKINEENADNSLVKMLKDSGLETVLPHLGNVAIQGELMGPGIQGNRENLKTHKFFIFDIQNIDTQTYFAPGERYALVTSAIRLGMNTALADHIPILYNHSTLEELNIFDIDNLLNFAEGPSLNHLIREGVVFKRTDGQFSFKAISNKFLMKSTD